MSGRVVPRLRDSNWHILLANIITDSTINRNGDEYI